VCLLQQNSPSHKMSNIKGEALYRQLYTEDDEDMYNSDQYISSDNKKPVVETSVFSSYVNLTNSIIGSGVLGLLASSCCCLCFSVIFEQDYHTPSLPAVG
jgi:hypothetical protein